MVNDSRLKNFGKITLQILRSGGTTKLTRFLGAHQGLWCLQKNPTSPDFRHMVTRKALSIYGWSTPPWIKAMFNLAGEGKMQPRTKDYQDTTEGDRLSKGHNGIVPTAAREYRHIVQGGGSGAKQFMRVEDMLGSNPTSLWGRSLIHMYAYSASLDDAQEVFGRMEEPNMISWNILIGGLTEHGCGREAFELFLQMQQEGIKPDTFTHASILNSCASGGALEW